MKSCPTNQNTDGYLFPSFHYFEKCDKLCSLDTQEKKDDAFFRISGEAFCLFYKSSSCCFRSSRHLKFLPWLARDMSPYLLNQFFLSDLKQIKWTRYSFLKSLVLPASVSDTCTYEIHIILIIMSKSHELPSTQRHQSSTDALHGM